MIPRVMGGGAVLPGGAQARQPFWVGQTSPDDVSPDTKLMQSSTTESCTKLRF